MKLKNISIKWRIFFTFLLFAIVLLGVLWFFQIIYLNDFYRMIKKNETEDILNEVEELVETETDCSDEIESIAASNNIAIFITDTEGNAIYNAEYISNSQMSSLPDYMFKRFYSEAVDNGGEATIEFQGSEIRKNESKQDSDSESYPGMQTYSEMIESQESDSADDSTEGEETATDESSDSSEQQTNMFGENVPQLADGTHKGKLEYTIPKDIAELEQPFMQNLGNDMAESIIYVRIISVNGQDMVLMVNSVLTPVDATVTTLKSQLTIISIIMIIVAFFAAIIISTSISKSIIRLNDGAKKLAAGDYSVVFNSRDYEEVSELTDTLNYAATELKKTDDLQKELIANVSHDLRTPLTMIKGYSEVMRDIPGENTPENVQAIIEETERLTGLVNDMLDISKLKAGTITIEPEEYNITESIRHVLLRYNKLREQEGYVIDFDYENDVRIYADEKKMYQVLYNLINNAINYTGADKKVTVIQRVYGETLRIDVKDTGNGVAQEDIPYVWDRYYKDKSNHIRAKAGSGIGLSIVKSILELHGAKYGVDSTVGQGADFWFEIPINPFEDDIEEDDDI